MDHQTIKRVRNSLADTSIGPETVALMLTKVCNLNCIYCHGGRGDESPKKNPDISDELSTQELFRLFADAKELRVKEINLGGMDGDPFCKKDVLKIMERIKGLGLMGSMTTNGSLLSPEIAKIITDYNWDILLVSFDSTDESIHHALRPARNQKPYFRNIVAFFDALNKIDSKLRILLNVVINKLNYKNLPELVKFANGYKNIESINILKLLNMGLITYDKLQLNDEELKEFQSILLRLKDEKKLMYLGNWLGCKDTQGDTQLDKAKNIPGKPWPQSKNRCFTNYYILSIDSNGDIIKCPQYPAVVQGLNIKRTSLLELWRDGHRVFREGLVENAPCFQGCCTILKEQNKLISCNINQ